MYDFLVSHGADPMLLTHDAVCSAKSTYSVGGHGGGGLTALQMACRNGNKQMVEHIIRGRWQRQWKWGPVTSYQLSLHDIDSTTMGGDDLMTMVLYKDALPATQEMLLDDFMHGFIYELFEKKWERYGRRCFFYFRAVDVITLSFLLALGISLKLEPLTADRTTLPYITAALHMLQLSYEIAKAFAWHRETAAHPRRRSSAS